MKSVFADGRYMPSAYEQNGYYIIFAFSKYIMRHKPYIMSRKRYIIYFSHLRLRRVDKRNTSHHCDQREHHHYAARHIITCAGSANITLHSGTHPDFFFFIAKLRPSGGRSQSRLQMADFRRQTAENRF